MSNPRKECGKNQSDPPTNHLFSLFSCVNFQMFFPTANSKNYANPSNVRKWPKYIIDSFYFSVSKLRGLFKRSACEACVKTYVQQRNPFLFIQANQ